MHEHRNYMNILCIVASSTNDTGMCEDTTQAMIHDEVQTNVTYQFRVQLSPANGHSCQCVKIEVNISRHSIQKWCMPTQLNTPRFCAVQGKMAVYISQPTAISQPTPSSTSTSPSISTTDVNCDLPFVMNNITDIAVAHDDKSFVCCPNHESRCLFPLTPLPSINEDEL